MDYGKYAVKAKNKIEQYGGLVQIIRKGEDEVYDPETNSYVSTETIIKGKGILSRYTTEQTNGTLILQGDVKLMCVLDSAPVLDDVLEIGGVKYLVKDIAPLNPDGNTVIYYNLQLRKK